MSEAWIEARERMANSLGLRDHLSVADAAQDGPQRVPGYEKLSDVLERAYQQAACGKGQERHSQGQPFHEQPMQLISRMTGTGFPIGQAIKKAQESQRLPADRAVAELLGAINYLAGAVILIETAVR